MVDFPAELLPYTIDQSSYSEGVGESVIFSPMDKGRPKRRKRFTAALKPIKFSFLFSGDDLETYLDWFENDIVSGATSFQMPHPRTGNLATFAYSKTPQPFNKQGQDLWVVPVELEVIP